MADITVKHADEMERYTGAFQKGQQFFLAGRYILFMPIVAAVTMIGVLYLPISKAATPFVGLESENVTAIAPARTTPDSNASQGNAMPLESTSMQPVKPTATNTGPPAGTTFTYHIGDYMMKDDGSSISNMHITGTLYMSANNVTTINVVVDKTISFNTAPQGNYFYPVKKNQVVKYCKAGSIDNMGFDTITIDHCHIGGVTDTFMQLIDYQQGAQYYKTENLILSNNLFDDLKPYTGANLPHYEAIHLFGVKNAFIHNNVFDYRTKDSYTRQFITAAVTFENSIYTGAAPMNIMFEGNWLYGGGYYQIYNSVQGTSAFKDNKFSSFPNMSVQYPTAPGTSFTQSGNTLDGNPFTLSK